MKGKEFHERFHAILDKSPARKPFVNADKTIKGAFPVMLELYKAEKEGKEVTSGYLSDAMKVSTARIAVVTNTLEEKRLVERYKNDADQRKTFLRLTNDGKKIIEDGKEKMDVKFDKALEGIPDEDLDVFFDVIGKILNNLKEEE